MPTITLIKPQKGKKRVNIYLDGKRGFGLDLETFVKHKLKVEQELTDNEIEKIIKESEFQTVYDKLLKFASLRLRSKKEFITWFNKHRVHKSLHEELFNRLKRLDLLNDERFANWWIQQRQAFRPKSKRVLYQELKTKGIDREIIDKALSEGEIDEFSAAKRILEKKMYMWKKYQGFEKRVKMSNFLSRKGYSWDTIRKVVSEFDQK